MTGPAPLKADLVLEGGGVKAIAEAGAVTALESAGYSFNRAAGTSAGAIAAAFVAAFVQAGKPASAATPLLISGATPDSIDYRRIPDGASSVPVVGTLAEGVALVARWGAHPGAYLRDWLHRTLLRHTGIERFGDLRLEDGEAEELAPERRYRLVVVAADVSRGSMVRLPWDYRRLYGLDPDAQLVADAVRASASIPFFLQPVRLAWGDGSGNVSILVDGGVSSSFPIEIFDRTDGRPSRFPTFGVKLEARPGPDALTNHVTNVLNLATATLESAVNGHDQLHLADPCVAERTIFIDTSAVGPEEWNIDRAQQERLVDGGRRAAEKFLAGWDWDAYRSRCRPDPRMVRVARGDLR